MSTNDRDRRRFSTRPVDDLDDSPADRKRFAPCYERAAVPLGPAASIGAPLVIRAVDMTNEAIEGSTIDALFDDLARFGDDFEGFVRWAFPWGEPGTSLADFAGPERWQVDQQRRISQAIREGGLDGCMVEEDISAGHGVGKSAEVSWVILWAIATCEDTRGVVTANTDLQLRTKTWAELGKWYSLFIAKQLFTMTATAIYIADDEERAKTWRIDQVPWSAEKTEAFAGLHNQGKRLLLLFDEASNIHDNIWTVSRGALTDAKTQIFWLRYGNPTRTSGEFFNQCTKPRRHKHSTYARVDSRTVSFTNKATIKSWIDEYGEDSDFVRVRVKGMFPRAGYDNFIAPGMVTEARRRRLDPRIYQIHQKFLSVDPARFGDDSTVITLRQGQRALFQLELQGFDGFDIGGRVQNLAREHAPIAAIVYDAIGNGAELDGVLKRMNLGIPLMPIMWGQPAKDVNQYFNQRSEAWGAMRTWLETGQVPDDDELADQLTGLSYGYDGKMRIQLESKKDARKRGVKSPDKADSLALSFIPELIDRKVHVAKVRPVTHRRVVWTR